MHLLNKFLLLGLLLALAAQMVAQEVPDPKSNSPFSRFGLGDLEPPGYATQAAMGGVGLAYSDSHIPNPMNPASLGALRYATYQVGVGLAREVLSANGIENNSLNGNLNYLSLSFTTRNTLNDLLDARERKYRYATMMALSPYSSQGYNIELQSEQGSVGTVTNSFLGTGGFYRLRSAHALEIGEQLRLGVSLAYIFGRTNTQSRVIANELPGSSLVTDTEAFRGRGAEFVLGSQYDVILARKEDRASRILTLAATATAITNINGDRERTVTRLNTFRNLDTLSFLVSDKQSIKMPLGFGVGLQYRYINHFSVGADFAYTGWNAFRNSLRPNERLDSGVRVGFGAEWIPDYQTYNKYHRTIRYRVGAYLTQDPRSGVNSDRGLSLGFGLPLVRPREELSYVNLSLNFGQLATPGDIDQRYLRFNVGFALSDNSWFYKRRFK